MTISERIFTLLKEQGKKQTSLAEHAGVRPSTITDWKKIGLPHHLIYLRI